MLCEAFSAFVLGASATRRLHPPSESKATAESPRHRGSRREEDGACPFNPPSAFICAPSVADTSPRVRSLSRLIVPLLLLVCGCSADGSWQAPTAREPSARILFIGNSYTFYNGGIDRILMQMARQRGREIACIRSARPGKSLQWHWDEGTAREFISHGDLDWVVLQDHSLQPLNDLTAMYQSIRQFNNAIQQSGARAALYMTWTRRSLPENQRAITAAYSTIAEETHATLVPCGVAWQRVVRERPDIPLYRPDGSHPTPEGSYLNACLFYAALLGDDPRGLPPPRIEEERIFTRTLSTEVSSYLQQVAWETVTSTEKSTTMPKPAAR